MCISEFSKLLARCSLSQIITITTPLLLLQVRILLDHGLPENYAFFANAITSFDHWLNKTQATQELVVFLYSLLLCLVANERNGDLSLVFGALDYTHCQSMSEEQNVPRGFWRTFTLPRNTDLLTAGDFISRASPLLLLFGK